MKKGNKTRLIFWGIIWIIVLILSGVGYSSYLSGHGIKGEVRRNLKPIVEKFNNLKGLESYKSAGISISAEIKDTQIIVTYKTTGATATFTFDYQSISTEKVLYMKYSSADEATANLMIKSMIEAVSMVNGHNEGEVFNTYKLEDFYNTTILDGVQIKSVTNGNEVYIDINKSIVDGMKDKDKNNTTTTSEITTDDLKTLKTDLTTNKEFLKEKETATLYIVDNTTSYIIFITDSNTTENKNYETITNVIKELTDEATLQKFTTNIVDLKANKQFENISVTINADITKIPKLTGKTNVTQVTITK